MYCRNRLWSFVILYDLMVFDRKGAVRYLKGDEDDGCTIVLGADKLSLVVVVKELVE